MPYRSKLILFNVLFVLAGFLGISGFATAAGLVDQFNVAKTKVLFLLGNGQSQEALAYVQQRGSQFEGTEFDQDWAFVKAVTYSNSGELDEALSLFQSLETQGFSAKNLLLEYGFALIKRAKFQPAILKLNQWKANNPMFPQAEYYLALAHFELDAFEQADALLTPLVSYVAQKENAGIGEDRVLYLYAATKAALLQYSASETALNRLINWPDGSVYKSSATDLLEAIHAANQSSKKLNIKLSLIGSADSNVTLAATSEGWDTRGAFQADLVYLPLEPLSLSYQLFASRHLQQNDYDLFSHTVAANWVFKYVPFMPNVGYVGAFNFLEGAAWLNKHEAQFGVETQSVDWLASVAYLQFAGSDDELEYRVSGRWQVLENMPQLTSLSLDAGANWTTDMSFASKKIGAFAQVEAYRLIGKNALLGKLQVAPQLYAPSEPQDSSVLLSASASASRNWSNRWSTTLKADAFSSLAQPEAYGYGRFVITATASWRY